MNRARSGYPDDGSYADHTAPPRMMDHTRLSLSASQPPSSFFLFLTVSLLTSLSPLLLGPLRRTGVRNPCRGRGGKKEREGKKNEEEKVHRRRPNASGISYLLRATGPGTGKKGPYNDGGPRRASRNRPFAATLYRGDNRYGHRRPFRRTCSRAPGAILLAYTSPRRCRFYDTVLATHSVTDRRRRYSPVIRARSSSCSLPPAPPRRDRKASEIGRAHV